MTRTIKCTLLIFAFFISSAFADTKSLTSTPVNACPDGKGIVPDEIYISDAKDGSTCTGEPCDLHPLHTYNLKMYFRAPKYLESLKPSISTFVDIINASVPFPSGQRDACIGILNTYCPLMEREKVEYLLTMTLPPAPTTAATITFSLKDNADNEVVVCWRVRAQIVP